LIIDSVVAGTRGVIGWEVTSRTRAESGSAEVDCYELGFGEAP